MADKLLTTASNETGLNVMIYSTEGLNNTRYVKGCCLGGNRFKESEQVNVNILIHALLN